MNGLGFYTYINVIFTKCHVRIESLRIFSRKLTRNKHLQTFTLGRCVYLGVMHKFKNTIMKKFNPESKLAKKLTQKEKLEFHLDFVEHKSILGIDIYKYSAYPDKVQVYVPVLFNSLYKETVRVCISKEKFFFQKSYNKHEEFKENFISTGDGGFQIFDNPIQSILFASYFQLIINRFNSGSLTTNLNKNLFEIIGRIELRYVITFDKIFSYDNNFFGAGIINNARILAKDNLNRLLVDYPTVNWFYQHINTVENLMVIKKDDFSKINYFKDYDSDKHSLIFNSSGKIKSLDLLKIGTIKSKNTELEVFNLKIQLSLSVPALKRDYKRFLTTVGNLNTTGIE